MDKLICFFKGHKRGKTSVRIDCPGFVKLWVIECKRCRYEIEYRSHMARLVGTEMRLGFDGD